MVAEGGTVDDAAETREVFHDGDARGSLFGDGREVDLEAQVEIALGRGEHLRGEASRKAAGGGKGERKKTRRDG